MHITHCVIGSISDRDCQGDMLTFWEGKDWTSWGRMFAFTMALARLLLWSASRPRARTAFCRMLGTTSLSRGHSRDITSAEQERTGGVRWILVSPADSNISACTCILEDVNILRFAGEISNSFHKLLPWFLVLIHSWKYPKETQFISGSVFSRQFKSCFNLTLNELLLIHFNTDEKKLHLDWF